MNKYRNKKTVIDGITFSSRLEADRYGFLIIMQTAGKISNLLLQPKYELTPSFKHNGKLYRAMSYIADFEYIDCFGSIVTEDTKGMIIPPYREKLKMFLHIYGSSLDFYEIKKYNDRGGIV